MNLAIKIKDFANNHDTYEYGDTFDSDIEAMQHFESMLQTQDGIKSLIIYFNDMIESEDDFAKKEAIEIKRELEKLLKKWMVSSYTTRQQTR